MEDIYFSYLRIVYALGQFGIYTCAGIALAVGTAIYLLRASDTKRSVIAFCSYCICLMAATFVLLKPILMKPWMEIGIAIGAAVLVYSAFIWFVCFRKRKDPAPELPESTPNEPTPSPDEAPIPQ